MDKKKFIKGYIKKKLGVPKESDPTTMKKSQESNYSFKDTKAMVSSEMQAIAETTGPKSLIKYLEASIQAELEKVRLATGTLNIYQKEKGLYGAFFQDKDGQVVEEFENVTIPILAKTLAVKGYYTEPDIHPYEMAASEPKEEYVESERNVAEEVATDIVEDAMEHHNRTMHKTPQGRYMRIKYGDFELEIKKSMQRFVSDFKKDKSPSAQVKKALQAWKRNSNSAKEFKSEYEAATALLNDWDTHGEEFSQILHAIGARKDG